MRNDWRRFIGSWSTPVHLGRTGSATVCICIKAGKGEKDEDISFPPLEVIGLA